MKKLAHIGVLMALLFFFPACGDKSSPTTPSMAYTYVHGNVR